MKEYLLDKFVRFLAIWYIILTVISATTFALLVVYIYNTGEYNLWWLPFSLLNVVILEIVFTSDIENRLNN